MKIASLTPKQWATGQLVQIKPKLRGWLHLAATPLSLAASIVLVCLAPTTPTKIGSAVYLACSLILFGVSATYHRFYWAPRWETMWKRLDHSNILPAHRRHLHAADHRAPKPLRRHYPPVRRLGRRDRRHPSQPLLAHRTALAQHPRVRRPRLGRRLVPASAVGRRRPRHRVAHCRGRCPLHAGSCRLRREETRPLPHLVRLPRNLPRLHRRRVGLPLHRRLPGSPRFLTRRPCMPTASSCTLLLHSTPCAPTPTCRRSID